MTFLFAMMFCLTGCDMNINVNNTSSTVDEDKPRINTESGRIFACNEAITKQFNIKEFGGWWDTEQEAWASFVINGTVTYEENGTKREKTVECVVDMVDNSVTIHEINETEEPIVNNQKTNTIITPFTGTSTFEELDTVVAQCEEEDEWNGPYFSHLSRKDFLLPYKNGYLGFDGWGNNGEGRGYYLTYRTLENPCTLVSKTPAIFFWVRNKWNVYFATDLWTRVPQKKVKDLNCSIDNFSDCRDEMHKFMYHLIVGDETQEYFSQWITKFKDDIDKGIFRNWEYRHQKSIACNEKHWEINENDPDIWDKYDQFIQECMAEYLH